MIFRRKNQIDISIENSKDLPKDSEFSSLSDNNNTFQKRRKINVKDFLKDNAKNTREDIVKFFGYSKDYVLNNKYLIWRNFLTIFSVFMLIFTFVMITWPFSYATVNSYYSPLSNFYVYDYSHLSLSLAGIFYVIFFLAWIGLLILHIFLYKKFENHKYLKENLNSKRDKVFHVIKFLSWSLFILGILFLTLMIIIPPIVSNNSLENQQLINKVISYVDQGKITELLENEKIKFLEIFGVKYDSSSSTPLDQLVMETRKTAYLVGVNEISFFFYNVYLGGVSTLAVPGIVFISFGSFFLFSSIVLFISKVINNYLTSENIEKWKLDNVKFNFNDVKENIFSLNNKIRGVYNTSQQKYQDYKNKDTFRKYKKRLIEEGKDTNPDKFTTDVETNINQKQQPKESLFSALKTVYKNKVKGHKTAEDYNNAERNRMRHKKPEIAVPDDELDELIDSLDIK